METTVHKKVGKKKKGWGKLMEGRRRRGIEGGTGRGRD